MQCASAFKKFLRLNDFVYHGVVGLGVLGLMVDWEGGRASLLAVAPSKSGTVTFAKPPRRRCDEVFNPVALDSVGKSW